MGKMIEGTWRTDTWLRDNEGRFKREPTTFRDRVVDDPDADYPVESGRYHLYVSYACPWAHRTLIVRSLMGLEDAVSVSVVHPHMLEEGWTFDSDFEGATGDDLYDADFLRELYLMADPDYTGRVTVPVLWDRKSETIVNNESREIIRMFSNQFRDLAEESVDLWPKGVREPIDEVIDDIYQPINNGVYRAGFATTQEAYDEAVVELFDALEQWDEHLGDNRYLCGKFFTEADVCMFTTLLRFDPVYYGHFKCNVQHVYEFENIWDYTLELYQMPRIQKTCHLDHIKTHYYYSHQTVNPHRIIPRGPDIDRSADHDRDELSGTIARR